ncbi:MAG: hypothetical protein LUG83_11385 [Lachnospiraceae bacterium]|nr:hypothetical protein [Lachnospiraceae bacterium]
MEVNRKLNAFGAILGAVGIFGVIVSLMILMNSIQYLRGITDMGMVTMSASTAYQFGETYSILFQSEDGSLVQEIPITQEEFDAFDPESMESIERRVYEDIDGVYHYYEDLDAKPMAVLEEIGMPFKLPILILIVTAVLAIGGFLWCFHGTPTKGRDLGEILQAKREAEEAAERDMNDEASPEKSKADISEEASSEDGSKADSEQEVCEKKL